MDFNNETTMKDIALSNPPAERAPDDAGLDYCCGRSKSLDEACFATDDSSEDIQNRLRGNGENRGAEDEKWMSAPLCDLTRYIREQHHYYVREAIKNTEPLLEKVITKHGDDHAELEEVRRLFTEVGREMIMHMQKEERILFPYIDTLEQATDTHGSIEPPFFHTVRNPIHMMMKEHDAAGELVKQIRGLTSAYTPPTDACISLKVLYEALREFEADLRQHVHLENDVLFPRAVELEDGAKRPG